MILLPCLDDDNVVLQLIPHPCLLHSKMMCHYQNRQHLQAHVLSPNLIVLHLYHILLRALHLLPPHYIVFEHGTRSEERRVGKECGCGGWSDIAREEEEGG